MDEYTRSVSAAMDAVFSRMYADGVYIPNEPMYGFRKDEPRGYVMNYIRHHRLLKALARFRVESVLDVGGGDGYSAFLVQSLLQVPRVETCDISSEACKRAEEIFGLTAFQADAQALPCEDNSYDVVYTTETLEHVADFEKAMQELLRVARYGVVLTLPHESERVVAASKAQGHVGDHLHSLSMEQVVELVQQFEPNYQGSCEPMLSPLLRPLAVLVDASKRKYDQFHERAGYPRWVFEIYNRLVPWMQRVFGAQQAVWVVRFDEWVSRLTPWYGGFVCSIVKEPNRLTHALQPISVQEMMQVTVPYFLLKEKRFVEERPQLNGGRLDG